MRRVLSITTALVLISSLLSPVLAAACTHTEKVTSCHRVAVQPEHCDGMHHQHVAVAATSGSAEWTTSDAGNCPMECCTQGRPRGTTAVPTISILPSLAMTEQAVLFVP